MKTKLLFALTLLFLFSGCSLNSEDPEPEKTYLLQRKFSEISFTNGQGMTIEWHYTYNQENQLTRIDAMSNGNGEPREGGTDLQYDELGRLYQITNELGWVWTHYYNDKNQLVKLVKAFKDNTPYTYLHAFNNMGKLVELKTYAGEVTEENYVGDMNLSYDKPYHTYLKRVLASGEEYNESTIITDDKKRPLPVLPHQITIGFHSSEIFTESLFTDHNVLEFKDTQLKPTNAVATSFTCSYTYNDAGYPLTSIKTYVTGSVEKTTYTYTIK